MADLLFKDSPAASGALVFGADEAVSTASALAFERRPAASGALVFNGADDVSDTSLSALGLIGELGGGITVAAPRRTATLASTGKVGELGGSVRITAKLPAARLLAAGSVGELAGSIRITARPPAARLSAVGAVGDLGGAVRVAIGIRLSSFGLIGELGGSVALAYDNNMTRYSHSSASSGQSPAAAAFADLGPAWSAAQYKRGGTGAGWQLAALASKSADARQGLSMPLKPSETVRWQTAARVYAQTSVRGQQADKRAIGVQSAYQLAQALGHLVAHAMQSAINFRQDRRSTWQTAGGIERLQRGQSGRALPRRPAVVGRWQTGMHAASGRSTLPDVVVPGNPCYTPSAALVFSEPWAGSAALVFVCEGKGPSAPAARVVVPTLRAYVTVNSIILRRVDGDIPIPAYGFAMSLDWQSWTWSWSASIELASLPLITPGSDGQPVEVEAIINGAPYRLCAEGFGSQRGFAKGRVGVKGRGLAAVLDAPYAPVLNFASASDRTAQQLMLDALTINGVSLGWGVEFGLTDWLVPGNTWAHQGEYISAVTAIAQAAGGYVQPHDTDKTLRILPGYPTAPWAWGDVTPDFELPSSVVTVEGIDWTRKPNYNRVFVSGIGGGGVLGQVTRTGTAGDIVATMVTHALITHADAARQRGLSVLADTGMQAHVNLTLPVLAETGLIKPGKFVRYTDAGTARMGLVRNTGLTWAFPKMRQTLAVETHI